MKLSVILNEGAAALQMAEGRSLADTVAGILRKDGWQVDLLVVPGDRIGAAAESARGTADIVVAGGGDGTISAAAGALAGTDRPLGVLPLGTFNHFARDLGIPPDLPGAAAVLRRGRPHVADLGEVNGRTFINNASIGTYPRLVVKREETRQVVRSKPVAMTVAGLTLLTRMPLLWVRLLVDGRAILRQAVPFVFVGNNAYDGSLFAQHWRERLDRGELWVYTARPQSILPLAWLGVRTLLRRPAREGDFVASPATEALVWTIPRRVRVALDGEVLVLRSPLRYRIRAGALRVMAPS